MTGGAASRDKGKRGELEAVHILQDSGWPKAHRTSRGVSQTGHGDIEGGPAGVHLESKRTEALDLPAAWRQVRRDARPMDIPVLVRRRNNEEWRATLPVGALLPFLRKSSKTAVEVYVPPDDVPLATLPFVDLLKMFKRAGL